MKLGGFSVFLLAAAFAAAQPGQQSTAAGSAFVSACAGTGVFSAVTPGRAWNDGVSSGGTTCSFSSGASVSQTQTAGGIAPPFSDFASGTAAIGTLHLDATNSGDSSLAFPDGVVNAGWNDMLTIQATNPALNGVEGFFVFSIQFDGDLSTTGNDPTAQAWVEIFQNQQMVTPFGDAQQINAYDFFTANNITHNGPIFSSWEDELMGYLANSSAPSLPINANILFAVPVTVGTPFELGIWAGILAGENSSGGSLGPDTASSDFSNTLTWGGSDFLMIDGQKAGFNVTSLSGFDYNQPAGQGAPEPSTVVLAAAGLLLLRMRGRIARLRSTTERF
jgi:hypothetical protein